MGSRHSVPRESRQRTRLVDQRNRLTKPRTNSNAISAPIPAFQPKLGSPRSSKSVTKSMSHRSVNRNSLIFNNDEHLKRRSNSLSLLQSSKQICDDFSWVGDSVARGMDGDIAATSPTASTHQLRRRSTLLAAPPATITRKPIYEEVEALNDEPAELAALDLAINTEKARCTTPSGYSVLGTFKRGSLRITNASPTPTSGTLSPLPTPGGNIGTLPSKSTRAKLERRASSVAVAITHHGNSIRITPPTQPSQTKNSDPTSPFSFQGTPVIDTYAWDIRYANAQLSGIQDSHPFPKPDPKPSPVSRSSSPKSIFDEIVKRQRALSSSSIPSLRPQRPSVVPASDSGYSSTSSTKSWKSQLPTETPSRDSNSRAGAYAALEGSKLCPTTAQIIRVRSSPTLRRPSDDEVVPEVPHVPRRLCKSPVPEKITGQTYYQRFTRRHSQIMTVESRYYF